MSKWLGSFVALFFLVLAGCKNYEQENKLVEKKVELMDQMSVLWESVKEGDTASFTEAVNKTLPLSIELNKADEDLKKLPGHQAVLDANQERLNAAEERLRTAKTDAKLRFGGKKSQ